MTAETASTAGTAGSGDTAGSGGGTRERERDRWWVVATVALVLWVGVRPAVNGLSSWPGALVGGVVYAAWIAWWTNRRRRHDARTAGVEPARMAGLERRIRHEDTPDDTAERQAVARLVRRRKLKLTRGRLWAFPLLGVIGVGSAALWFVAGENTTGALTAAGAVVFTGWLVWLNRRTLQRFDRLERRLGA
jgi:hypothetical protein